MNPSSPPSHPLSPILDAPRTLIASMVMWTVAMGSSQYLFFLVAATLDDGLDGLSNTIGGCLPLFFSFPFVNVICFLTFFGAPLVILHIWGVYAFCYSEVATFRIFFWVGINQIAIATIAAIAMSGFTLANTGGCILTLVVWYVNVT